MQVYRKVETSFVGPPHHMVGDGFRVSQYFPAGQDLFKRFSPFLVMDYNSPFHFSPILHPRGVGAHPHRGFETVTIIYDGKIEHHDNSGNHGVIETGEVQWMTAGSGVLHKEYHEKEFAKKGGMLHLIQLWVDLPKEHKMTKPKYQSLRADKIKVYEDEGLKVCVIAGQFYNIKNKTFIQSSTQTFSPINLYNVFIKKGYCITLFEPSTHNVGLLLIRGRIKANGDNENEGEIYQEGAFLLFENTDGVIKLESLESEVCVCVLSGEPLKQEVFARGPFVMSSMEEIRQAFADYEEGKFGKWNF